MQDSFDSIFKDKQRILAIFAHPDDMEVYAGGLVMRLVAEGKQVRSVKMTSGGKGSRDNIIAEEKLVAAREAEDLASMKLFGISEADSVYLRIDDGFVENNHQTIEQLAKQIRQFKPDLIITHNPEKVLIRFAAGENWVNHRDHRHTGLSAVDAAYPYSRDTNFFPDQLTEEGHASHATFEFLFVDHFDHLDLVHFDITNYFDQRVKVLGTHESQFSQEKAASMSNFFAPVNEDGRRYETFRHVVID